MTGDELKKIRKEMGWSQERLAEFLGVDRTSLSHMENGRVVPTPVVKLLDLLRAQGLSANPAPQKEAVDG